MNADETQPTAQCHQQLEGEGISVDGKSTEVRVAEKEPSPQHRRQTDISLYQQHEKVDKYDDRRGQYNDLTQFSKPSPTEHPDRHRSCHHIAQEHEPADQSIIQRPGCDAKSGGADGKCQNDRKRADREPKPNERTNSNQGLLLNEERHCYDREA